MKKVKLYPLIIVITVMLIVLNNQLRALDEFVPLDLKPYSNTKLVGLEW